ncbi:MAG TPA: hypothetical protein VGR00_08960, partial [Thermoanaerobaculia bacterium]|nr:hypothetical protein [Thermoanaerobaculia bacterium]
MRSTDAGAVTEGEVESGVTVTSAEPKVLPSHFESETVVTEYVVVDAGLTLRIAGLMETICGMPSDHMRFHAPTPVSAIE